MNPKLIGWICLTYSGDTGGLFVAKEHRGKNIGAIISQLISKVSSKLGHKIFGALLKPTNISPSEKFGHKTEELFHVYYTFNGKSLSKL